MTKRWGKDLAYLWVIKNPRVYVHDERREASSSCEMPRGWKSFHVVGIGVPTRLVSGAVSGAGFEHSLYRCRCQ